jgi:2-oxoglutarate ferredoxin oxidoreductase subunit gamma
MTTDVFMAGFGGQGILLAGNLLAYAAIEQGLNASFFPAYGVEKRGGAANCTVIVTDGDVGSPVVGNPGQVLLFNQLSLDKFYPRVRKGGLCLINSSLAKIPEGEQRDDIDALLLPATDMAVEAGDARLVNMVMLGAFIARCEVVPMTAVKSALAGVLPERNHRFLPMNYAALDAGAARA